MPFCFYVISLLVLYYDVTIALNNNLTSTVSEPPFWILVTHVLPVNTPFCSQPFQQKVTKIHRSNVRGFRDTRENVAWVVILSPPSGGSIRVKRTSLCYHTQTQVIFIYLLNY